MADNYNEGCKPILDHIDIKNRQSIAAWEERLWQRQLKSDFVDPRDEHGRQLFRRHISMLGEARQLARKLSRQGRGHHSVNGPRIN